MSEVQPDPSEEPRSTPDRPEDGSGERAHERAAGGADARGAEPAPSEPTEPAPAGTSGAEPAPRPPAGSGPTPASTGPTPASEEPTPPGEEPMRPGAEPSPAAGPPSSTPATYGAASPDGPAAPDAGVANWAKVSRWTAGVVVLLLAAVLGGVAIIAGYVRDQVLDTNTYVATVTPLISDPTVQDAMANRLSTEIVAKTDLSGIADDLASRLVKQGAPQRITDLVPPLISGITSFLNTTIRKLLASSQFQAVWQNINRAAHAALVTVLTGQQSNLVKTTNNAVTIDLGQLLIPIKQQLVAQGLTLADKIPNISIPYTIVTSDKLPKIRTYVRALDAVGTWLPFVALAVFVGGFLITPNRRRGILTGMIMFGVVVVLLLAGLAIGRSIYLDQLPSTVQSPQAAANIYDTILRFLNTTLRATLVAVIVVVLAALLAGPSRLAHWIRHQIVRGLDAAGGALGRTGPAAQSIGKAVLVIRRPVEFILAALGVLIFVLVRHPTPAAVLWLTFGIVVVLIVVEILARMSEAAPTQPA